MTLRAWAELLRVSALFTVPGDALAGAASRGLRPDRGTALALGSSLCLYEAGMALNDWADREEDAIDRPHRPIPSGRITPGAALLAAGALTAAGLTLASSAGRRPLALATALAATVWSYDLHFKHTRLGPAAMATARGLDLLLGAVATGGGGEARALRLGTGEQPCAVRLVAAGTSGAPGAPGAPGVAGVAGASGVAVPAGVGTALSAAGMLAAHTYAVTSVSRHETQGGSTLVPLGALAATLGLAAATLREHRGTGGSPPVAGRGGPGELSRIVGIALAGAYVRTAGTPLLHAALNPSPPLTQRAVGGGIRAMIPLQAALAARAGGSATALAVMGLVPLARKLARKVSPT